MGRIYGRYGGPMCQHYDRLSMIHYRNKAEIGPGESDAILYNGTRTPGPHAGVNKDIVCLQADNSYTASDDAHYPGQDLSQWRILSEEEFLATELTSKHSRRLREHQADTASRHGFRGPIKGGEARALSRFLRAIGKEDCVRRLWLNREYKKVWWPGTAWAEERSFTRLAGPLYAFKPFMDGVTFDEFMRIFRMMRPGCKDARKAIREAMANPTMKEDLEMLSVFDTMADMGGSK